jgi:hypothetical protein
VDWQGNPRDLAQLVAVAAQPEALAAHVESWLRGQQMNFLRKQELLRDEQFRLKEQDFGTMLSWSFGYRGDRNNKHLWTPEVAVAHERLVRARIAWLEANPGDDLSPESVARVMVDAQRELARAQSLEVAVEWVREVESEQEERSATLKNLERRLHDAKGEVTRKLERIYRREDAEFVGELYRRCSRMRSIQRWRHQLERGGEAWPHRLVWLDFGLSRMSSDRTFDFAVRAAKSIREVRRLLSIWHVESRVVVEDGVKIVVGDLGEGGVVKVFPC